MILGIRIRSGSRANYYYAHEHKRCARAYQLTTFLIVTDMYIRTCIGYTLGS